MKVGNLTENIRDSQGPPDPEDQEAGKVVTWDQHGIELRSVLSALSQTPNHILSRSFKTVTCGSGVMAQSVTCLLPKARGPKFKSPVPV